MMDTLLRRWRAKPLWFRDAPLALALTVLAVVDLGRDGPVALLALVGALSLVWRRSAPVAVLAITGLVVIVATAASSDGSDTLLPALAAVYTVVTYDTRWIGVAAAGIETAWFCASLILHHHDDAGTQAAAVIALYALAVTLALAVCTRRDLRDAAREGARLADERREIEAARGVAEERLRDARELHGVIGRQAAVVNVQAAVAEQLLFVEPAHARAALDQVQEAGRTMLTKLSALVEVLRESDDELRDEPQPGMNRVDELVASARAAGLALTTTSTGEPRRLPPVADLTAYRVLEESLTNARKHGDGSAHVTLTYLPSTLVLEIANPVPSGAAPTDAEPLDATPREPGAAVGPGLDGMREQVTALGGTLQTGREPGPDGDEFVVRAVLPAAWSLDRRDG